jgi:threonine dehydratase
MYGDELGTMVDFLDVEEAAARLQGKVRRTEVTLDGALGDRCGGVVCVKWENHQITGSFKVRGALNAVISLPEERRRNGVTCSSSGNHGLGVCYAAREATIPAVVCVPDYASPKKIAAMRGLGAEVRVLDGPYSMAEATAIRLAQETGASFISPYNDSCVVAGQGTLVREWLDQVPNLDVIVLPVGGAGLSSGVGLALKALRPTSCLYGVSTEGSPFVHAYFHGHPMEPLEIVPNLADGITGRVDPASITLPLARRLIDGFVLVNDDQIARAVAYCYDRHNQVVEGAAAVGLAALLAGKLEIPGRTAGVLITGGNITPETHQGILRRGRLSEQSQQLSARHE